MSNNTFGSTLPTAQREALRNVVTYLRGANKALDASFDQYDSYHVTPEATFALWYVNDLFKLAFEIAAGDRDYGLLADMLDVPTLMPSVGHVAESLAYEVREIISASPKDDLDREADWEAEERAKILEKEVEAAEVDEHDPTASSLVDTVASILAESLFKTMLKKATR